MPTEKKNLQGSSASPMPYFSEDVQFPGEIQVNFWKPDPLFDSSGMKIDSMSGMPCSMPVASLPVEKIIPVEPQIVKHLGSHDIHPLKAQKANLSIARHLAGANRLSSRSSSLWSTVDHGSGEKSDYDAQSTLLQKECGQHNTVSGHYENGLFSSSLSELFHRKLTFPATNNFYGHSVGTVAAPCEEEVPSASLEEIEAQTIGNLLPDEDDLFSGVVYGLEQVPLPGQGDDTDDADLFNSVGGMELGDDNSSGGKRHSELGGSDVSITGEYPYDEHPSRTLIVRNIDSNVENSELRVVFEQYGDISALFTAYKHRGFAMISYYDIRSAQNAMKCLQNKPLRHRKLDIHFSSPKENLSDKNANYGTLYVFNLDSSITNGDLHHIFGIYGEIKGICEAPDRNNKFVEFYDVRAAEAALRALNRTVIAGKRIKLEPSRPGLIRRSSAQNFPPDVGQDEAEFYVQSVPGSFFHGPMSASVRNEIGFGTPPGFHSHFSPHMENRVQHGISSSVPSSLSPFLRNEITGKQPYLSEAGHSFGQIKKDFQGMPAFHSNSLPEHPDGLVKGGLSSSMIMSGSNRPMFSEVAENVSSRIGIQRPCEASSGFSSSGNGSCPVPINHSSWSRSNNLQSASLMWPDSPSFTNGVSAPHPSSQLCGLPRAPSDMLKSVVSMTSHHVGSAPNYSAWDRRHAHVVGSPDASCFHQGPLGSMPLSGSPLRSMEFIARNAYPQLGGNCMDLPIASRNAGAHSHHRRFGLQSGRSQMNSSMNSFEHTSERLRSRRSDNSSSQLENKKQYELDLDRILRGEDNRTTLMIKNIPNKYTSKMLMATIDERHQGTYDFIYLPIDFKNKCNVGYAFINMTDPGHIIPLYETFDGKKWEKFNSEKVATLAYARIQGKQALIAHFQNSSLMNEDKRCRPILLHTDGPNAGDQIPFPMGANIRTRTTKLRSSNAEDNQQESENNEGSSNGDSSSGSGKESD